MVAVCASVMGSTKEGRGPTELMGTEAVLRGAEEAGFKAGEIAAQKAQLRLIGKLRADEDLLDPSMQLRECHELPKTPKGHRHTLQPFVANRNRAREVGASNVRTVKGRTMACGLGDLAMAMILTSWQVFSSSLALHRSEAGGAEEGGGEGSGGPLGASNCPPLLTQHPSHTVSGIRTRSSDTESQGELNALFSCDRYEQPVSPQPPGLSLHSAVLYHSHLLHAGTSTQMSATAATP